MLKAAVAVACTVTLAATVYLTISLLVLQPPHADYGRWARTAGLIVAVGGVMLGTLAVGPSDTARIVLIGAAAASGLVGALIVYRTVSAAHFEGYALVLGAMLVVQAALAATYSARRIEPPDVADLRDLPDPARPT